MKALNNLLQVLIESDIDFVLIGGFAAVLYGSSQVTQDIDICAALTAEDIQKFKNTLKNLNARHRMNPNFQPSLDDFPAIGQKIENLYLTTSLGTLDVISDVKPIGEFERIKSKAVTIQLFGKACKVISLEDLIEIKKSMKRPKDQAVLQELLEIQRKR